MSDELEQEEMNEQLGIEEAIEEQKEVIEEEISDDPIEALADEDKEFAKGWQPDGEKSLDEFVRDGKFIRQIEDLKSENKKMSNDFEKRIKGLTKLQQMQMDAERSRYEQELADAVNMSDLEGVKAAQGKIAEIDGAKGETEVPQGADASEVAWNTANPWINEMSPKSSYARDVYAYELNQNGGNKSAALSAVDAAIAKEYPDSAPTPPPRTQKTTPSRPNVGGSGASSKLMWNDLTKQELDFYDSMGGVDVWDKKDYLQAVTDNRKGQE